MAICSRYWPTTLLVAAMLFLLVPVSHADAKEQWPKRMQKINEQLVAGRYQPAFKAAAQLVEEMAAQITGGPNARQVFALALFLQAAGEAGTGAHEDAEWHWHLSRALRPDLDGTSMAEWGDAGAFLSSLPLRPAGKIFGHPTDETGESSVLDRAALPLSVPAASPPKDRDRRDRWFDATTDLEIMVDVDGRPHAPLVGDGTLPDAIYHGLEAVRAWRFAPAIRNGVPAPSIVRLVDLRMPDNVAFVFAKMAILQPINTLVATGLFEQAKAESDRLLDDLTACALNRKSPRCDHLGDHSKNNQWLVQSLRGGTSSASTLGGLFALRALAHAGLGEEANAIADANRAYNLFPTLLTPKAAASTTDLSMTDPSTTSDDGSPNGTAPPPFPLALYGPPANLLAAHRPRCWTARDWTPVDDLPGTCDARMPAAWPSELIPPIATHTPRLAMALEQSQVLGPDRLVVRFVVDTTGRVREPRMLAGRATLTGLRALDLVKTWRFSPALEHGQPVAVVIDAMVPLAPNVPEARLRAWAIQRDELEARIIDGTQLPTTLVEEAQALVDDLARSLDGGTDLLTEAILLLAVAEVTAGDNAAAIWHWHVVQNLSPRVRHRDLDAFGLLGSRLAEHRLRAIGDRDGLGIAFAPGTDLPTVRIRSSPQVRFPPMEVPRADRAEIELIIGPDGHPRAPIATGWRNAGRLYLALEGLRQWRFDSGRETPVLHRLRLPLWHQDRSLKTFFPSTAHDLARSALSTKDESAAVCLWSAAASLEPNLMLTDLSAEGARGTLLIDQSTLPKARWGLPKVRRSPIHVTQGITQPVKVSTPMPSYSDPARRAGIQGIVIVQTIINIEGRVRALRFLKSLDPGLDVEAAKAICHWRFEPATIGGEPIEVYYNLTTNFRVSQPAR